MTTNTELRDEPTLEGRFFHFVNMLFVEKRAGIDGMMHACIGLSGEAGECLDMVKKSWVYGRDLDDNKLQEEAGDTLHYLVMLCLKQGWSLHDLMLNNMAKLEKRYPNGFSKEAAIARADVTGAGDQAFRPVGADRGPSITLGHDDHFNHDHAG